jgi:hypothetical protein
MCGQRSGAEASAQKVDGTTRRSGLAITGMELLGDAVVGRGADGLLMWDLFENKVYAIGPPQASSTLTDPPGLNGIAVWWTAADGTLRMVDLAKG